MDSENRGRLVGAAMVQQVRSAVGELWRRTHQSGAETVQAEVGASRTEALGG